MATTPTPGAQKRADQLVELARAEFGDLLPAEVKVLRAAACREVATVGEPIVPIGGEVVGCAFAWYERESREAKWKDWTVRGPVLRWLCGGSTEAASLVEPAGVIVIGAVIEGTLDLSGLEIRFLLACQRCVIRQGVNLDDASTDLLSFEGSFCKGLSARRAKINGSVFCRTGFACEGRADFSVAEIDGDLACSDGSFVNKRGPALHADGVRVAGAVFLRDRFSARGSGEDGAVRLLGAEIGGNLDCNSGSFVNESGPALHGDRVRVTGDVFLSDRFSARGSGALSAVRLLGADIGGDLGCVGGSFVNENGPALAADGARVVGAVFLCDRFSARGSGEDGAVRLLGAEIGGNLDCNSGSFVNESGPSLHADGVRVTGDVFLRDRFSARGSGKHGAVRLLGAEIGGDLACSDGSFENSDGMGLDLQRAVVRGALFCQDISRWQGGLDMTASRVGALVDDKSAIDTIDPVHLDGLHLSRLGPHSPTDGAMRAAWITDRSGGRFVPQSYETIAAVLDRMGQEDDARTVRIALERERHRHKFQERKKNPRWRYAWCKAYVRWAGKHIVRVLLNYGYDLWRPVWFMLGLSVLGALLFLGGYRAGLMAPASDQVLTSELYTDKNSGKRKDELPSPASPETSGDQQAIMKSPRVASLVPPDYPAFNAFVYSLHTLLPIVDLRQQQYWLPSAERGCHVPALGVDWHWAGRMLRWYMWVQTLAGWTLTTFLIAGVTGLVKHKTATEE